MVVIEDFTKLSVGVQIPTDGRVGRCPRCGRNGVPRQNPNGIVLYIHVQKSTVLGDGLHTEPTDCCALTASRIPAPI